MRALSFVQLPTCSLRLPHALRAAARA